MQKVLFIRGLPGSGKSTMAQAIADDGSFVHIEADHFFELHGPYKFNASLVRAAHAWCLGRMYLTLESGKSVVVSNTFINKGQLRDYFKVSYACGIRPLVWVADGDFGSIHGVPAEKIKIMKDLFEDDISSLYDEFEAPKTSGTVLARASMS